MMLAIAIEADAEWDSRSGWDALVRAGRIRHRRKPLSDLTASPRLVELSVRLATDDQVRTLNAQWRGKDKPTNVLSFPLAETDELSFTNVAGPELLLGDIVLAHGVCTSEAADKAIPVEQHATHLLIHGTLHLLGYDHQDDDAASDMEAREVRALARLGFADPYEGAH